MQLAVDHAFHIGAQHLRQGTPNQDYALSGVLPSGLHYGIVADGCSSGGETDIGARLMGLALKQALAQGAQTGLVERARAYLEGMRRALDLERADLLATGLLALANDQQFVKMLILGDGVLVERSVYGTLYAHKFEWSDNAPGYLAYSDEERSHFFERQPTLTREFWSISGPEQWQHHRTTEESAFVALRKGVEWTYEPPHGPWDLASIGIFSDGVLQVDGLPWQAVIWELMRFKSARGQFVTRRMNRFLTNVREYGCGPLDDIAMAVINLTDPKPTQNGDQDE